MWDDEILAEIHQIREKHAKELNYDVRAMCADWRRQQVEGGRRLVRLSSQEPPVPSLKGAQ